MLTNKKTKNNDVNWHNSASASFLLGSGCTTN